MTDVRDMGCFCEYFVGNWPPYNGHCAVLVTGSFTLKMRSFLDPYMRTGHMIRT